MSDQQYIKYIAAAAGVGAATALVWYLLKDEYASFFKIMIRNLISN